VSHPAIGSGWVEGRGRAGEGAARVWEVRLVSGFDLLL